MIENDKLEENNRGEQWYRHMAGFLANAGAVDLGGFIERLGNILQARQKYDYSITNGP